MSTTSSRDAIFAAIRAKRPPGVHPLPEVPLFEDGSDKDQVDRFRFWLDKMGGHSVEAGPAGDVLAPLRDKLQAAKVVCSIVPEYMGNRDIATVVNPHELADVDYAIVRASFGVAESGSVLIEDVSLGLNALAYLAQHLIVLLDPAAIVPNMHHAYRRREFHDRHYVVFHTGPSATADIEGVLIHGAQGVRSLTVVLLPAPDPENDAAT